MRRQPAGGIGRRYVRRTLWYAAGGLLTASGRTRPYLRAMLGLSVTQPRADGQEGPALIENCLVEVMAILAWIPAWGVALGLVLIVGLLIPEWDAFKAHVAAVLFVPLAFAVAGFVIHMTRALVALGAGQRLALSGKPAGRGARAILHLTSSTPWILLLQLIVGVAVGVVIWNQAPAS